MKLKKLLGWKEQQVGNEGARRRSRRRQSTPCQSNYEDSIRKLGISYSYLQMNTVKNEKSLYIGVSLSPGLSNGLGGKPRKECNGRMFEFITLILCSSES